MRLLFCATKMNDSDIVTNPFLWADVPDPDVIRVGHTYYMTSTTMHFTPGCPVMKSKDLVNWQIVNYVYDVLDDGDNMILQNGRHDYGRGSWASSLRYHGGIFYVAFAAYNTGKTYIFQTRDIENGTWERHSFDGIYHDMSILFDDDGRVYMAYGGGGIKIVELASDVAGIKPGGLAKTIIENADISGGNSLAEGSHIHKLNGMYYIFVIVWPSTGTGRRLQVCYRSDKLEGPYEGRIVLDDDMGFQNAGVAQGGIIDTPCGNWYAMLFQDHGAVGRVPVLVPVSWKDGWPLFGENGKAPKEIRLPIKVRRTEGIVGSDEFDEKVLALWWQWNHNPYNENWSLAARPGWLRLTAGGICNSLTDARNTLTQRTFGPACSGSVLLDAGNMQDGDFAGLAALQAKYAFVGVKMLNGKKYITMSAARDADKRVYRTGIPETEIEFVPLEQNTVYLRIDFDFADSIDEARFYYSLCGKIWIAIGGKLEMSYRLSHFTGYRFALFNYATKTAGGYVDFDWFRIGAFPVTPPCQSHA